MTPELLSVPVSLSPRLRWLEAHGIALVDNGPTLKTDGDFPERRYCAHLAKYHAPFPHGQAGWGDTEDEAIVELAKKLQLRLWNEV